MKRAGFYESVTDFVVSFLPTGRLTYKNSVTVVIPQKISSLGNALDARLCGIAQNDANVVLGTVITGGAVNF
jgi:hypothetical protein